MLRRTLPFVVVAISIGVAAGAAGSASSAECATDPDNLARCATARASSQNASTAQTAAKAIDGVVGGWPGDYTTEWATMGGKAGSTLTLTWSSPQQLGSIVLHDRPNADDQITRGSIGFSDGSKILVPALPNGGEAMELEFRPRSTTSLRLTVDAVSTRTYNIGLSEIGARAEDAIASFLGVTRTFADADAVVSIAPRAVSTLNEADGVRLVRVDFELIGLAGSTVAGASDFVMVDADGTRYSPVPGPADAPTNSLDDRQLRGGETMTGAVYFSVPSASPGLLIAYLPTPDGAVLATWTLNAP